MNAVRIKICGITRIEDALAAAELGVDAIGLVFYAPSPRAVSIKQAQAIVQALPPFVTTVGLFVNATQHEVIKVCQQVAVDVLQFHGDETEDFCVRFERPYIKALRMKPGVDLLALSTRFSTARGLLLDAYKPGVPGGTGEVFDWLKVPAGMNKPIILAGGLTAENVIAAMAIVQPWAVDVSGGVEARKGVKDVIKLRSFVNTIRPVFA